MCIDTCKITGFKHQKRDLAFINQFKKAQTTVLAEDKMLEDKITTYL